MGRWSCASSGGGELELRQRRYQSLLAAVVLGKSGFDYIKQYIRRLLRRYGPPKLVSVARYVVFPTNAEPK